VAATLLGMDWEHCGHWYNTDTCWSRQVNHVAAILLGMDWEHCGHWYNRHLLVQTGKPCGGHTPGHGLGALVKYRRLLQYH
jgi:hypothetical protein